MWPDLVAVGSAQQPWQLNDLTDKDLALLDQIESAPDPVLLDRPDRRASGKHLEQRLLVAAEGVHTDTGRHLKALTSWAQWADEHAVVGPMPSAREAMQRFESIVETWEPGHVLLPWM